MKFTKMHGAGNDFILINNYVEKLPEDDLAELAFKCCARRHSVGADGLILASPPKGDADVRMVFYNADGSRGEMCGNGARCLARFSYEEGLAPAEMLFETPAGLVHAKRLEEELYWVRLPNPSLIEKRELLYQEETLCVDYVELGDPGVPHLGVKLDDLDQRDQQSLFELGRALRYHPALEKGANVNFFQTISPTHYLEKTYERGVEDFTMACGAGSASVALALQKEDPALRSQRIQFSVPGGELYIESEWSGETVQSVDLIGPAIRVYDATCK